VSFVLNTVYLCLLVIGSPWLLWRYLRWGKNRRGWGQKLFGLTPIRDDGRPCIWFHAVSVGEVNLLAPVLQRLNSQRPDVEVVISTTTETGFDLAKNRYENLTIFFFPFDFSWAIKNALKRIKPNLIVLSELELWPNFVRLADQFAVPESCQANGERNSGIPIVVINGRLSEPSYRGYRRLGFLMTGAFQRLSLVMAQNETYAKRFLALGCCESRVVVTGSVKFDGLQTDRQNQKTQRLARLAGLQENEVVFVAGSTQFEEDVLAARTYQLLVQRFPRLRLVLVPRHPERVSKLVRALNQLGLPVQLRSRLESANTTTAAGEQNKVLVVDVIGELGAWWGVADAAYVGGSMGSRGGQNMIEPAAYGIPIAFGPHTENFKDTVTQLLDGQAASIVHDLTELTGFVERVLADENWASQIGKRAQDVVLQHDGASERTVNYICELLGRFSQNGHRSAA
jgi:3-deoxy-D-manno-octulosonic-acid transferase